MDLARSIFLVLFVSIWGISSSAQESNSKQVIISASGGQSKWQSTRYFLFTATGNKVNDKLSTHRKFLFDKISGDVRFEGKNSSSQSIVLLFNFKSNAIEKYFVNNEESPISDDMLATIIRQFHEDTSLLFLPFIFANEKTVVTQSENKIVDTEKRKLISFTSNSTFIGKSISGIININSKGEMKQLTTSNCNYSIGAYKDIGGGLHLPTSFVCSTDKNKNCVFGTVAAFTEMENNKFSDL